MVERLKQEGASHNSSDLVEDLCEYGGQLVSTGFQTDWCHTVWAWCLSSLVLSEDLAHIIFTDLECRWGEMGVAGSVYGVFQTCNRTHSDRLLVVDSPQRWGMVSCSWWCLSDLSTLKPCHWKRIGSLTHRNNSSLPLWSPFPVCIWPVYTRICSHSCK